MSFSEIADALHAAVAPADFFRRRATRVYHGGIDIILVGTLHGRHLGRTPLNVGMLRRLIDRYEPVQVGIEARPLDLDTGIVCLSPIDIAYIWAVTQVLGLPVFGLDWWSETEFEALAASQSPLDFNSAERNDRMVQAILRQIAGEGRNVLFTGYSHVAPIRDRLLAQGFEIDRSFELDIEQIAGDDHEEAALRRLLQPHLQRAVRHLDGYLEPFRQLGITNPWTRRVLQKRNRLAQLIAAQTVGG